MATILVVSGPNEGETHPLRRRSLMIGRDEACPIQIVDATASRRHALLRLEKVRDAFVIQDLSSANGLFVNDRRVTGEVVLGDGDIIRIGTSELMFSSVDFPDEAAVAERIRREGEHGKSTVIEPPAA
jgi:pSer/pThr/pTyr-binding forkhead associated (FHA) protein